MKKLSMATVFVLVFQAVTAQNTGNKQDTIHEPYNSEYILHVRKAESEIILDGILSESDWQQADKADRFHRVLPVDTGFAIQQSEILMTYDEKALYLAMTFYDTLPGKRIMESYRRDFSFNNNDNLLVFFDTFLDQTNGFSFGLSASGAKWDGLMSDGYAMSLDWDCKWESETRHYPDRWVAEMRIPFKSVRYPAGSRKWYANFSRLDLKSNEKSAWAPVPRQFPTASLAYTGIVEFEGPLPKPTRMFSFIPYIFGGFARDYEAGNGAEWDKDFGFDAKIGISSSMNLDLTFNPDFAQVEVDQQVTNIERFELFFPEKRQFFLENSDLFAGFGTHITTPFFSRRIGLDAPVLAGARLSGKIGNNWRIGFMNMMTRKTENIPARNFTVASVQKKVFARSNFGFILVNKEYLNSPGEEKLFNRVAGVDYNLASKDNIWSGKYYYHRSFQPGNPGKQYSLGASLRYNTTHVQASIYQRSVGEHFLAETGYVPRTGYHFISPDFTFLFVPNKRVVSHGPTLESDIYYNMDFQKIEHEHTIAYMFSFQDRSSLMAGYKDFFVKLQEAFDPTHVSSAFLPAGNCYDFGGVFINYQSTRRTLFNWQAEVVTGKFYNGKMHAVDGQIGYRYQPYLNLAVNFTYTNMKLPAPFTHTKFWLVGPRLDLTFTDKIFLTSFVQYNEQMDNMNINVRFQWRYQPVSDFFVVYTDNYFPGTWTSRNRALVVKLTYWLN
jgi:hypothetical protein